MKHPREINVGFVADTQNMLVWDDFDKRYALLQHSQNPTAKEVMDQVTKFAHGEPDFVNLTVDEHEANKRFTEQIAQRLKNNKHHVAVSYHEDLDKLYDEIVTTFRKVSPQLNQKLCREQYMQSDSEAQQLDKIQQQMEQVDERLAMLEDIVYTEKNINGDEENVTEEEINVIDLKIGILGKAETEKLAQRYVDFANAIVPNSTEEISDLKTGTVWLHLLNKMFSKNYMSGNPRKNYNNCMKMLQANEINAEFILKPLEKILEGEEEANIYLADDFRDVLNQCDHKSAQSVCDEIEDKFDEIQKARRLNESKENKEREM